MARAACHQRVVTSWGSSECAAEEVITSTGGQGAANRSRAGSDREPAQGVSSRLGVGPKSLFPTRSPSGVIGKGNELGVARNSVELCHLPIGFGLLDAILSRRDEVPPDVPGAVHGLAPEGHKAGVGFCPDGDAVTRPKDKQLPGAKDIARNLNLAGDCVD